MGSGSTVTYAPVIVWDKHEYLAKEEQLVLINDGRRGIKYLGILRNARRYEPFLNTYRRTSYVDNPSLVDTGTLPHTSAYASLIGVIGNDGSLSESQLPPNPGSRVYVIEGPDDLGIKLGEGLILGTHKYSGIEVPLDPRWLPYHLAVVGATGTGKSRLVKALIDEVLSKTTYNVIVFDHTGMDYVRYYPGNVVNASRVVMDVGLIADLMLSKTGLNRTTYESYLLISTLYYLYLSLPEGVRNEVFSSGGSEGRGLRVGGSFNQFMKGLDGLDYSKLMRVMAEERVKWDKAGFKSAVSHVAEKIGGRSYESVKVRLGVAIDVKLGDSFFKSLSNRDLLPSNIVDLMLKDRLVIIDLSSEDLIVRRYVVASVINELWRRVEEGREPINTVVVVDEAHNYACRSCGESRAAICRIAREGRKWGLGLVLATQRIIDIDTEVRGNINTWIFSRLQTPSDFSELSGYMNLAGIGEQALAVLERREFYVAGLMNPLKIPVLIRVRDVR